MTSNFYLFATLISLTLAWLYIFWLYRDFRVDQFRQQMFKLRDETFDAAAEGKVSFEDEAYGLVRVTANGFIRFAHVTSLSRILVYSIFRSKEAVALPNFNERFSRSLTGLPVKKQQFYRSQMDSINRLLVRHLLLSSPVLLVTIMVPTAFYYLAATVLDKASAILKSHIERLAAVVFVAADPM